MFIKRADEEIQLIKGRDFEHKDHFKLMFTIENLNCENIGGINLNSIDEKNDTFSIGRLNKFNDYVLEGNEASIKMMRKLGCLQEGVRRKVTYTNGQYLEFDRGEDKRDD